MDKIRLLNNFEKAEENSRKSKHMKMNTTTSEFKEIDSVLNGQKIFIKEILKTLWIIEYF